MIAALTLPRLLDQLSDRAVMIPAAALLGGVHLSVAAMTWGGTISWPLLLGSCLVLGIAYSAVETSTGSLLRCSATQEDRPAVFAVQFALSYAAWPITYPLAGWFGAAFGMPATLAVLRALTVTGVSVAAAMLWPASDPAALPHAHGYLDPSHPHVHATDCSRHAHGFVIEDRHRKWPARAG